MSDQLHLPTSPTRGVSDTNEKTLLGSVHQSSTEPSSMSAIQSSHHVLSPKPNAGDNHTPPSHTAAVSPTQPLDSANTTYSTLYNEFENSLRIEFYDKLRTHMYDGLHTELSEGLPSEVASNLYTQVYIQLYPEMYTKLSDEVLKKLSKELFMKIANELLDKLPHDLFMKLINDLHTKLLNELSFYASGKLYHELFSKLHADIYNQLVNPLANQMTDSADDNHSPCDEDNHHRHHQQQQQHDQQKQEQPQQPPMTDKDESSTSINASPQPLSSFTITSLNGQLDIPRLGNMERFDIRSYNVSPFALHIMLLAVLAENPDILLPLASLKECFFHHVHRLNEECFSEYHVPAHCNKTVINLVIGVTCARLNYAIDRLYPPSEEEIGTDPRKRVIPALEKEGSPILQDIIRDSLSVYNPMRVLLSYLRSLTTRYHASSFATPEECDEFIKKDVLRSDGWIRELEHLCSLYGLYLWDSQWITNEEWKELAHHMNIFYTEIFPYVKDDFAIIEEFSRKKVDDKKKIDDNKKADDKQAGGKMFYGNMFDDKKLDDERFDSDCCAINIYFKTILRCIASCFAFRYRPMKDPSLLNIPYGRRPFLVNFDPIWVETDVHQQTMQMFPDVLKQCVKEYMKNPTAFSPLAKYHLEEKYLLTVSNATAKGEGHTTVHDYIMSELDDASKILNRWVSEHLQKHKAVKWRPKVVGYGRNDVTPHMMFLIDCIVKHPPTVDPVYNRIKDVFPKEVNLSNIINDGCVSLSGDPGFTYHESSSSSS